MYQEFSIIYDKKIKEDFDYPAMAAFIKEVMKEHEVPFGQLLDMGCGSGNASFELNRDFQGMVLCDPSEAMLVLARDRFKPPYMPQFILSGAESFSMPGRFDVILSILDIPNYLPAEGFRDYLKKSYHNLKEGGILVFDISSEAKLKEMAKTGTYIYDEDDYFHVWENHLEGDGLKLEIHLFVASQEKDPLSQEPLYRRITEIQYMQMIKQDEILKEAEDLGFTIIGVKDGYTRAPVTKDSKRIVFVLKKEKNSNG